MVVRFLDAVFQQGTFKIGLAADSYHDFCAFTIQVTPAQRNEDIRAVATLGEKTTS